MRYPKEAILFQLKGRTKTVNGAPVAAGSVVEFYGYDAWSGLRARRAFNKGALDWWFEKKHLRPLTPLAREVWEGL